MAAGTQVSDVGESIIRGVRQSLEAMQEGEQGSVVLMGIVASLEGKVEMLLSLFPAHEVEKEQ